MWPTLVPDLICPSCRARLGRAGGETALACTGCGRRFEVRDGVPRLGPGDSTDRYERGTLRAFRRQWERYGRLRRLFGKDPGAMRKNLVGPRISRSIDEAWYAGRRVLDAGCGHGRYLEAFASLGARVVGLDMGPLPRPSHAAIDLVQGSVLGIPFRDGTFDLVFSDGVIHHTPDPARAFAELARVVRPGGALYVWVYPREGRLREALFGAVRALTTKLPGPLVVQLAFALAPLTLGVRSYSGTRFGRATWSECAQVVHDWIAPPLQSHHDYAEVAGWAAAAGLTRLERLPVATGITAWKPASSDPD